MLVYQRVTWTFECLSIFHETCGLNHQTFHLKHLDFGYGYISRYVAIRNRPNSYGNRKAITVSTSRLRGTQFSDKTMWPYIYIIYMYVYKPKQWWLVVGEQTGYDVEIQGCNLHQPVERGQNPINTMILKLNNSDRYGCSSGQTWRKHGPSGSDPSTCSLSLKISEMHDLMLWKLVCMVGETIFFLLLWVPGSLGKPIYCFLFGSNTWQGNCNPIKDLSSGNIV